MRTRLPMSARGDASEREASRTAHRVLLGSRPRVQTNEHPALTAPAGLAQRVASLHGEPLPLAERAFFEARFGHDFSQVRIHSDAAAAELARSVDAGAFTLGNSIILGNAKRTPQLVAHELAHIVQQASLTAPIVQREDPEKQKFEFPSKDAARGFRPQDLAALQKKKVSLSFSGSLAPLPADMQKLLLENISETVIFALDPNHADRVIELEWLRLQYEAKSKLSEFYDQPAERVDSTDLYHGHVCVPKKVLDKSPALQKLRNTPYSGFGKGVGSDPQDDIEAAIGKMDAMPTTRADARKVMKVVDKHRQPFLNALSPLLQALATETSAGVMYHSWENVKPKVGGKLLPSSHPVRHIFTPFNTNRPEFRLEGNRDCDTLINFGFHVDRNGKITLFPGSEKQMVRAFEILQTPATP